VAAGNFTGHGDRDVAIGFSNGDVVILTGNGDGTFNTATPPKYSLGNYDPSALALADFNKDGKTDIAVADGRNSNHYSVLLGNGDGTFQSPKSYGAGFSNQGPESITAGDFNGDGNLGVAGTSYFEEDASALPGNGDGTLGTPDVLTLSQGYSYFYDPTAIVASDLNGDGLADLAVVNAYGNLEVHQRTAPGSKQPRRRSPARRAPEPATARRSRSTSTKARRRRGQRSRRSATSP
jgi:hypothetical protein